MPCKNSDFRLRASGPTHAKAETLRDRPSRDRTPPCRGLAAPGGTSPVAPSEGTVAAGQPLVGVDHVGGDLKAGLIRGCSLCTTGEALGHGYWIDAAFIDQLHAAALASGPAGLKSRFTHPSLSGDGLGTFLGRMKSFSVVKKAEASKCIGDLHLSPMAHKSPDGDLAEYVMGLADSDPSAFAQSIVFEHDFDAEAEFALANGAFEDEDELGPFINMRDFKSPDPFNVKGLAHARVKALHAADMVDSPAANPNGLFHREQQFAQEADAVASFAMGLTDQVPAVAALDIDPHRTRGFVSRFLEAHGLEITKKGASMPDSNAATPAADALHSSTVTVNVHHEGDHGEGDNKPGDTTAPQAGEPNPEEADDEGEEGETASTAAAAAVPAAALAAATPAAPVAPAAAPAPDARAECKRFMAAFGANGATWFAEGLSFEDAQAKYTEALAGENAALKGRLAATAASLGEATPVSADLDTTGDKDRKVAKFANSSLGPRLAAFAAGIKLPDGPAAKTN